MNKKQFRLLSKAMLIFFVFIIIAFSVSIFYLVHAMDIFIEKDLEHSFKKSEFRLSSYIQKHHTLPRVPEHIKITLLQDTTIINYSIEYKDTVMLSFRSNQEETFRKKTFIRKIDNNFYRFELVKHLEDFLKLRAVIFRSIFYAFALLMFGVLIFNYLLSGMLFKPFYLIIEEMQKFRIGTNSQRQNINSSTIEFRELENMVVEMTNRINKDFQNLKEYTENMSHELQTPLTIIRNKLEKLMADEIVMDKQSRSIKSIYNEINHLSNLGKTLNLLTKIENGEFQQTKTIHTKFVIEKHLESVQELASLKNIDIQTDISEEHTINMDPFLFDIVIKNLIRNSIRYGTNEGPITIHADKSELIIGNFGQELKFPSNQIFSRFRKLDQNPGSLGLGLAIVKKICDLNNLTISYNYSDNQHWFVINSVEVV